MTIQEVHALGERGTLAGALGTAEEIGDSGTLKWAQHLKDLRTDLARPARNPMEPALGEELDPMEPALGEELDRLKLLGAPAARIAKRIIARSRASMDEQDVGAMMNSLAGYQGTNPM